MESLFFAAVLTSLALAAAMTLFAWSVIRQNRRREAARVALLSGLAFPGGTSPKAVADVPADDDRLLGIDEFRREASAGIPTLFGEPERSAAASRRMIALGAVAAAVMIAGGAYRWFAADDASAPTKTETLSSATTVAVTPPAKAPSANHVELLSLNHRATSAQFLVTGRVRNPSDGSPLHDVVAVVNLVDSAGRVLLTVRAPVKRAVLNAGDWTEFAAVASKATNVARYRVGFEARERDVVPHIDLRQAEGNSRSE